MLSAVRDFFGVSGGAGRRRVCDGKAAVDCIRVCSHPACRLFLCWHREGALSYETMRSCMVILSRMLGYEDEDIWEYLENSFERLIWDWGYFALVVS